MRCILLYLSKKVHILSVPCLSLCVWFACCLRTKARENVFYYTIQYNTMQYQGRLNKNKVMTVKFRHIGVPRWPDQWGVESR